MCKIASCRQSRSLRQTHQSSKFIIIWMYVSTSQIRKQDKSQECGIRLSLAQIQDARVSQFIDIYSSFIPPPQKKKLPAHHWPTGHIQ